MPAVHATIGDKRYIHMRNYIPSNSKQCSVCGMLLPTQPMQRNLHLEVCLGSTGTRMQTQLSKTNDVPPSVEEYDYCTNTESNGNSKTNADESRCDNVHTLLDGLSARDTLCPDHVLQYLDWGPQPLSPEESMVAQFLARMSSGMGTSTNIVESMLDFMHLSNPNCTMPKSVDKCWEIIENAHSRMTATLKRRSVTVSIPDEVQSLLFEPIDTITWEFWNPCDLLVRMVTMGPLSANPKAFALFPVESCHLDDFCHGEKMNRIFNAIPKNTCALSAILFFDEINRDQKGFVTGEGAVVVGAFFNKEARESTYAKASFGTFPKLPIPKVHVLECGIVCGCSVQVVMYLLYDCRPIGIVLLLSVLGRHFDTNC